MKSVRRLSIVLLTIYLLNLTMIPLQAQNTSVLFKDMNMILDDVSFYSGVRIVVFFSPSCYACKEEVPTLKKIEENYNVSIFMLDVHQPLTNETLVDFIDEMDIPEEWTLGFVTDASYYGFNISYFPVTIVLDDEGRIAADILGAASYLFLEDSVVNAIEHNTDEYFTDRIEDPGSKLDVIFIVVGVIVAAVVLYFLIKSIPPKKKKEEVD